MGDAKLLVEEVKGVMTVFFQDSSILDDCATSGRVPLADRNSQLARTKERACPAHSSGKSTSPRWVMVI